MARCNPRVTVLLSFYIILFAGDAHARTWDLAVAIGHEVDFLSSNGTLTGRLTNSEAISLTAMAYDPVSRELYLGDSRNRNVSIFSKSLREDSKNWTSVLPTRNSADVIGMALDPATSNLFYIDSKLSSILKLPLPTIRSKTPNTSHQDFSRDQLLTPSLVLNLPEQTLRGLTLDLCNGRLYWTNSNTSNPSIESSDLSGLNRRIVVNTNLYEPVAVAVDHSAGKLYWIDDEEGIHYKIERSNLDGSMREMLVHGKHQQPFHLTLDNSAVYWTDWVHSAVWKISKTPAPGNEPEKLISFFESNPDADPTNLVSRDNLGPVDCVAVERIRKTSIEGLEKQEMYEGLMTSTEDLEDKKEEMFCLNGGGLKKSNSTCKCPRGYEGMHCENSVCYNYCVHGECKVDFNGRPRCNCLSGFRGKRCEQDICTGFCLNGGECSIENGEPFCKCEGSRGVRCEETETESCRLLCASRMEEFGSLDRTICRCSERNTTLLYTSTYGVDNNTLITIFSVIIGILTTTIIVLSYFVNKFRRRPRIKKRFVVSKNGITPLTSRPQLPGDQCEIMIENCCNMNICETPCFEPNLRSPEPRISKKEEKNSLLLDMEGNNSC